ncbi:MAG TPA: response regulator [Myxococcota bacterium]|nr:response regulator [Myxococcota bacterium]
MAEAAFPALNRVLVVEDDRPLCGALARIARSSGAEVCEAHTLAEGRALLSKRPQLMIVDLWLEGESAMGLLEEAAKHRPAPAILAISGRASNDETFLMGKLGAAEFLCKPLFHEQVVQKAYAALAHTPDLDAFVKPHVGKTGLKDMQNRVRNIMLDEAIAKSGGSRSGAARLLKVTRQAIQQVFHRQQSDDDEDPTGDEFDDSPDDGAPPAAH